MHGRLDGSLSSSTHLIWGVSSVSQSDAARARGMWCTGEKARRCGFLGSVPAVHGGGVMGP